MECESDLKRRSDSEIDRFQEVVHMIEKLGILAGELVHHRTHAGLIGETITLALSLIAIRLPPIVCSKLTITFIVNSFHIQST